MATESRQSRRVLLGSLLILGLIGGALLIFFLDDMRRAFRSTYTIVAIVDNAPDLAAGSPVWIAGRQVGTVITVGFVPADVDTLARISVTLELPRSAQTQVRSDSRVRLTSENLISERVVDIIPGTAGAPMLEPGDTIEQDRRPTAADLAARAGRVKADLDSVLVSARELAPGVRSALARTQRAFQGLDLVMAETQQMQRDLAANPGAALLGDPAFRASLDGAMAAASELPRLLNQFQQQDGAAGHALAALSRLQARADSLQALLAAASLSLSNPNGTLSRMQQDTALQRAIAAARAELDSLMADVRRNPLRYAF